MFEVEYTDEFEAWWGTLTVVQQDAIAQRIARLAHDGPRLRRPIVGEIKGSKHDPRMKELVVESGGSIRVLFIFDPRSTAILLLGGDKSGQWNAWYPKAIKQADDLYDNYLDELRAEGLI